MIYFKGTAFKVLGNDPYEKILMVKLRNKFRYISPQVVDTVFGTYIKNIWIFL